jgi:hypothetical protein
MVMALLVQMAKIVYFQQLHLMVVEEVLVMLLDKLMLVMVVLAEDKTDTVLRHQEVLPHLDKDMMVVQVQTMLLLVVGVQVL